MKQKDYTLTALRALDYACPMARYDIRRYTVPYVVLLEEHFLRSLSRARVPLSVRVDLVSKWIYK
jgi:hypothetical protein